MKYLSILCFLFLMGCGGFCSGYEVEQSIDNIGSNGWTIHTWIKEDCSIIDVYVISHIPMDSVSFYKKQEYRKAKEVISRLKK